jgi:SAM-dependent methyltransferase
MAGNGLIKWMLNHISRERLQNLAATFSPVIAWWYRGDALEDPIDHRKYKKFLSYGYGTERSNALSPGTLSLERHRALYLYLKEKTDVFTRKVSMLHIAPERSLGNIFKKQANIDYLSADLLSPWAMVHFDAHAIPYRNDTFDIVIANHILEHVQDDRRVMAEMYRVMKPGGFGVFQVPLDETLAATREDPFLRDEAEQHRLFGQKDHVRQYGIDYLERLASVGFRVKNYHLGELFPDMNFARYGVHAHESVPVCFKD